MFVWSKLSSVKEMDAWEALFAGDPRLVISRFAGRDTIQVEVFCEKKREAEKLAKAFGGKIREVRVQNWAAMTPEAPPPVKVRDALLITSAIKAGELAELAKGHPRRKIISIPPELAFGTGHHATTSTMLRMLVDHAKANQGRSWTMLDLGAGSGVLAIAAEKLGASEVWGCDFDAMAMRAALKNLRRNKTRVVTLEQADVLAWEPVKKWDCVVANLFSDILEAVFPKILRAMNEDGVVMISGILKAHAEGCLAVGTAAGLVFEEVVTRGKWVTARGRLKRQVE